MADCMLGRIENPQVTEKDTVLREPCQQAEAEVFLGVDGRKEGAQR
jgi:hypothetical protein